MKQPINLVWMKRDIRTQDHAPLYHTENNPLPYLIIFIFEPSLINYPDTSLRHLQFQYHSIIQVNQIFKAFGKEINIFYAEVLTVLDYIQQYYQLINIYSYQESGIQLSYQRDQRVAGYCKSQNIQWYEYPRDGVVRGIKNRNGWDQNWFSIMHAPLIVNTYRWQEPLEMNHPFIIPHNLQHELNNYPSDFQPAGEVFAFRYLNSFVKERGKYYSKHISKPLESRMSCGRISPYLSWGNISIKQVYQFVNNHINSSSSKISFRNFLTRLKWHCHFIQKFEVECKYETHCINAGYELLQHHRNPIYIDAWIQGNTGYPLVDACIKCLQQTGWINFRMRAMIVSFFCHHLYQDWRDGVYPLAQLFLDYEPGIHYPQFQMQAGTTGINTIRIYNPVKQSKEQDPQGIFIKKWLPQLQSLPLTFIHEPYLMNKQDQQAYGVILGETYPEPLVNLETSGKVARDLIWGHLKNDLVQKENLRILLTHTRRKK